MTGTLRTVTHRIRDADEPAPPGSRRAEPADPPRLPLIDLNLLHVFLAIAEQRSLTAAGVRLGLTQPAISHALRRLRGLLDDPLFVRTPSGMAPTDVARQLSGPIAAAYATITQALQQCRQFDPCSAERAFKLSMSDMAQSHFLPPLLSRLAAAAPGIRLEVSTVPMQELGGTLRSGAIDLALGFIPDMGAGCISQTLFEDEYVGMVRAAHPMRRRAPTREDLAHLRYVVADSNCTGHRIAARRLEALDFAPTVAARLPHFMVAAQIIQQTDLAMLFPRRIAQGLNRGRVFRLFPLPFPLLRFEVQLHWHERYTADAGLAWLRALILEIFGRADPAGASGHTGG